MTDAFAKKKKKIVRSEGWINPQDRFLLQSIALGDEEGHTFQAATVNAGRCSSSQVNVYHVSQLTKMFLLPHLLRYDSGKRSIQNG